MNDSMPNYSPPLIPSAPPKPPKPAKDGIYFAGHFEGDIKVGTDGKLDFEGVKFHLGNKSEKNIEKIIPKLMSGASANIGNATETTRTIYDAKGGKSIKKRVRKNRKTKKTRRNRK